MSHALPDPFLKKDGSRVITVEEWPEQAKYIRELAQEHLYGEWPGKASGLTFDVLKTEPAFWGAAIRETIQITYLNKYKLLVDYVHPTKSVSYPVFVYNATRMSMRCPIEKEIVLNAGYGIAAYDRESIRPDREIARMCGYLDEVDKMDYPELPCGDIMAWGWGSSIVADFLSTRSECSAMIATGHSRGGKAALAAGIFDDRFDVVAPMGSGCGGAGCARFLGTLALDVQDEKACETIGSMAHRYPTWMCDKYAEYGSKEPPYPVDESVDAFPLDAHMLRAACAPRAVFNSEGMADLWANSFGTQLARDAAQPVFDFLGVSHKNGFHIRPGFHDFNYHDWSALVDFCDIVLSRERKMPHDDTTKCIYCIDVKKYAPWYEK